MGHPINQSIYSDPRSIENKYMIKLPSKGKIPWEKRVSLGDVFKTNGAWFLLGLVSSRLLSMKAFQITGVLG